MSSFSNSSWPSRRTSVNPAWCHPPAWFYSSCYFSFWSHKWQYLDMRVEQDVLIGSGWESREHAESAWDDITITAHILICVIHVGMDVKEHNRYRALLRVKSVFHGPPLFLRRCPVSFQLFCSICLSLCPSEVSGPQITKWTFVMWWRNFKLAILTIKSLGNCLSK